MKIAILKIQSVENPYKLSEIDFRVDILRLFKNLKETMEHTGNKTGRCENKNEKNTNSSVRTEKLDK